MSYESDYRYRPHSAKSSKTGGRQHPMDLPTEESGKGLFVAALVIVGFIAFVALMSIGGAPEDGTPQAIPADGTSGVAPITAAPAQGE